MFTVKSCYRLLQGECDDAYKRMWKRIWTMKLPRKVAHVLWRLCKECLPSNAALYNRYVDVNPLCPWCHSEIETNVHTMFLCDFALTLWRTVGLHSLVQCTNQETPKEVLNRVFHRGTKDRSGSIIINMHICLNSMSFISARTIKCIAHFGHRTRHI